MGKANDILKKLGPGLLFAGTAIGVSHLVQSTKAGAEFGFGLTWALFLAIILKYPFFKYAPKYSLVTNESVLHGYKKLHTTLPVFFFLITLGTMFTIQTAVTIVTAGLANSIFGDIISVEIWTLIILLLSFFLLLIGKYKTLDKLIKYLIIALTISTILSFIFAALNFSKPVDVKQVFPTDSSGVIFLIAFMGWMPAPLDVSIWQSIWTKEKISLDKTMNYKTALFDFNIGYLTTVVLGICFIGLGAFVMYNSGESFSNNGGEFAGQLINLYTSSLGENMFLLIAIAAFTTMFSTTLTCLDASPRAMGKSLSLLGYKKLGGYTFWLILLSVGTFLIFVFLMSEMGSLVRVATILSFVTAPIYAILNYTLVTSKYMPKQNRPNFSMKIYSILGIIFLTFFSIWYLTLI